MQNSVKERLVKLRGKIAQISEANRLYLHGGKQKPHGAVGDSKRRLERLQAILDELVALTDWKNYDLVWTGFLPGPPSLTFRTLNTILASPNTGFLGVLKAFRGRQP
jgi:hypothetical protein